MKRTIFFLSLIVASCCNSPVMVELEPGAEFKLAENYIRMNTSMSLSVDTEEFESVSFGRGEGIYMGHRIDIVGDSLFLYHTSHNEKLVQKEALGFFPCGQFVIKLDFSDTRYCDFFLKNGRKSFETHLRWWGGGAPFVTNTGRSPMKVALSYEAHDLERPVWIIGDSYINWNTPNRWPYYIYEAGYRNWMSDHLPGGASERMLRCLKNDLVVAGKSPQYLVWAIGMNDFGDSVWLSCIDEVLSICEEKRITPILTTVPSVPERDHRFKTEWVRGSGYRYIDFAKAVGSDSSVNWTPGMLFSDKVHPDSLGAAAMAAQVLNDFPEIKNQ